VSGVPAMAAALPRRIGVFGGSFNPPHMGHVLASHFALSAWLLDRIVIVPNFVHAFGKPLESFEHRFRMCMIAFQHLECVEVSRIEESFGGVSYTIDTITSLRRDWPRAALHLLIGSDVVGETAKWRKYDEVKALAPPLVLPRGGEAAGEDGMYLPPVSSTWIRQQLAAGQAPGVALPAAVYDYIRDHGLYAAAAG
jgi:nicotinate-nucleotide adenylyltransferase